MIESDNTQKCILIADSGSTKTDWLLKHSSGISRMQSDGLNPFYQNKNEVQEVIERQVLPFIKHSVDEIYFYGSGCADEVSSMPVKNALLTCFESARKVEVASDMLGASRGLCGHEPGLACILGTGSNNAVYNGHNNVRSIGSLGFWLGDEGSGSFLGKSLVVHFLQDELPQDLKMRFSEKFPEVDRLKVLDHAYKKPFPNRYFATFTHFIGIHVSHPFISNLIANAFGLFIEKYVMRHPESKTHRVHFTGSIAYHFKEILESQLESKGLRAGQIIKSPMEGLVAFHR